MEKKLTHEEKSNCMIAAASLANIELTETSADLLLTLYELIKIKQGETTLLEVQKAQEESRDRIISKQQNRTTNAIE